MACCNENSMLPNLICAITGKGPLKDFWTAIIKFKQWKHVKIITPWLSNEDYPKLLGMFLEINFKVIFRVLLSGFVVENNFFIVIVISFVNYYYYYFIDIHKINNLNIKKIF